MTARTEVRDASESTPTAAERAYQEVRQRILDGRLPAGRRLKELDLARELGISRTPVREALSRLNVEGLLDFRPNLGATVAVWSEVQIEQMFRIRAMLEPFAAEIAAGEIGGSGDRGTERPLSHHGGGSASRERRGSDEARFGERALP